MNQQQCCFVELLISVSTIFLSSSFLLLDNVSKRCNEKRKKMSSHHISDIRKEVFQFQ